MSEQQKDLRFFIQNGVMHGGSIMATLDFNLETVEGGCSFKKEEIMNYFFNDSVKNYQAVKPFVDKGGKWFLLTGMSVVHESNLYETRKDAADAYHAFLMDESQD
jgi:hypothetical protein